MKKSLIALAVSSAFVVPVMAQADTTVYGLAQVEVTQVDPEAGGTGNDTHVMMSDHNNGRVGVKASEDLGNGWAGLAKFEYKADTADGTAGGTAGNSIGLTPRETMVGLKGKSVGQFELGRLKSPYKYSGGVKYDPFVATQLEARGNGGMVTGGFGAGGFLSDTIGYRGNFGPVNVQAVYGPSSNDGMYSIAGTFKQSMFEVGAAIIDSADRLKGGLGTGSSSTGTAAYSSSKVFGKVTFGGMHTIVAQYEMTDDSKGSTGKKPTLLFVGYHLGIGKNMFVGEFGSMDSDGLKDGSNKSYDTQMIVLGAIHKMSKTMRVFAGYRSTSNDAKAAIATDTNGMFLQGQTSSVISIGMRKDFK